MQSVSCVSGVAFILSFPQALFRAMEHVYVQSGSWLQRCSVGKTTSKLYIHLSL
jgi:hypothetical protein